jgi:hypothetical protein
VALSSLGEYQPNPMSGAIRLESLLLGANYLAGLAIWFGVGASNLLTWQWVTPGVGDPTHPTGTWMTLASSLLDGIFYPPLFQDGFYGGTRYAPLQIAMLAAATRLIGDVLIAANLLAVATGALLLITVVTLLRRAGIGWPLALAGTALVGSSEAAMYMLVFRGDALPAALQLGALLAASRPAPRRAALAGIACALAVAAKTSAVWGIGAVVVWLLWRRCWRDAAIAVAAASSVTLALFLVFEWWSDGRMSTNLFALTFSELGTPGLGPLDKIILFSKNIPWLWLLTPFALEEIWRALTGRLSSHELIFGCQIALLFAFPVLLITLADAGGWVNHVIDVLVILTALGMAGIQRLLVIARPMAPAVLLIPIVAVVLGSSIYLMPLAAETLKPRIEGIRAHRYPGGYRSFMLDHNHVLSDNPAIPLLAGQRPVVLDAFMLRTIDLPGINVRQDLARRILTCEFDAIVLFTASREYKNSWGNLHFGTEILDALIARYRFVGQTSWGALHVRSETCPTAR